MSNAERHPYFELRIGGFRMTAERFPVRLLTALATAATSGVGTWLLSNR
ncbi:hypothetical protein QFZ49_001751 [Streptomyces turgidiscabies]|uniref:Uncharacterized protein n=1 Tax=Streptomyces turgidiscabies TaxID=85558 RepID=A0ABU0RIR8_9ACTN|nr:hypothetical protein [Streptomyces turgidiscabies]